MGRDHGADPRHEARRGDVGVVDEDRVRGLAGLLRDGHEAAGVQDAQRLAGAGAADEGVVEGEAELLAEGALQERFVRRAVLELVVGRVREADEAAHAQLDVRDLRLALRRRLGLG